MTPSDFYSSRIEISENQIQAAFQKVRRFTFLRLIVFVVAATFLYKSWGNIPWFSVSFSVFTILFLWIVNLSVNAKLALEKARELKKINEDEQKALSGDWSAFDSGVEFQDGKHPFSNDLDLFASKGVFGFVNRTTTQRGKKALADLLLNGSSDPKKVNEAINFLSQHMEWTQGFRVSGAIKSREEGAKLVLNQLFKSDFHNPAWTLWLIYFVPLISIPCLIAFNLNLVSSVAFTAVVLLSMFPTGRLLKSTNLWALELAKYESRIQMMLEQIEAIQALKAERGAFENLKSDLNGDEAINALVQLLKIHKRFELRMNILISVPFNIFLAWDLRQRIAMKRWINQYSDKIESWECALTQLEVYISGATIYFNADSTIFAEFTEEDELHVLEMRHPLLIKSKAISNDVTMREKNQFMILTGPNMAGKSTYLRALGLLFVFANAGFPVFATNVKIPRLKLYSSMRTSDDLASESSYFHAELMRLKFIVDALERDQKIFILLDEILKGTNSKDKEEGSKRFLKKLQKMGARGIIATHDLSLCELANEQAEFSNGCFDSTIIGDELFFDYKWREGICQNMNASFLLKKMNLVD